MEGRFHELPPLKRFKLMQKQNGENFQEQVNIGASSSSCLPAKKRKESRDFSPLLPDSMATAIYCLPAKKRVWAIRPFDLNVEYNSASDDELQSHKEIPFPNFHNKEAEAQSKGEKTEIRSMNEENENNDEDDDDGIVCAICESTDGDPSDPIVLCDGCDLMVHTTCYGHPFTNGVPDGDWFCDQCLASQSIVKTDGNKVEPFSCCLCPVTGGALKPTTDGKWAHVVCALFIPEVFFEDPEGRKGVDTGKVPTRRWKQRCYICKSKKGCAIDCSEPKCPLAFHASCGLKKDLCIEYTEGRNKAVIVAGFCRSHTDLWIKQQQTGKFKIVARDKPEK